MDKGWDRVSTFILELDIQKHACTLGIDNPIPKAQENPGWPKNIDDQIEELSKMKNELEKQANDFIATRPDYIAERPWFWCTPVLALEGMDIRYYYMKRYTELQDDPEWKDPFNADIEKKYNWTPLHRDYFKKCLFWQRRCRPSVQPPDRLAPSQLSQWFIELMGLSVDDKEYDEKKAREAHFAEFDDFDNPYDDSGY